MDKELPKGAKVVVIGGGVAGTSCAYPVSYTHLTLPTMFEV